MARNPFRNQPEPENQDGLIQGPLLNHALASMEAMQGFFSQFTASHGDKPREEFQGLSPGLMDRMLSKPFDSPDVVVFNPKPACVDGIPFMRLFRFLSDSLSDNGLKATANGNLPRQFCRDAALAYWGAEVYAEKTRYRGINGEADFGPLSEVRRVAEMAGLIRLERGCWRLDKRCRDLMEKAGLPGVYMPLFRAFVLKFKWGDRNSKADNRFLRESFAFSLYLLVRHGAEWQPDAFYADLFLAAFPLLLDAIPLPVIYSDPKRNFTLWYSSWIFADFAQFWGLAETEDIFEQDSKMRKFRVGCRVKASPLLSGVVSFPTLRK